MTLVRAVPLTSGFVLAVKLTGWMRRWFLSLRHWSWQRRLGGLVG
jgi:hypothetical protein